jgi:hypothetical protein
MVLGPVMAASALACPDLDAKSSSFVIRTTWQPSLAYFLCPRTESCSQQSSIIVRIASAILENTWFSHAAPTFFEVFYKPMVLATIPFSKSHENRCLQNWYMYKYIYIYIYIFILFPNDEIIGLHQCQKYFREIVAKVENKSFRPSFGCRFCLCVGRGFCQGFFLHDAASRRVAARGADH